MVFIPQRPDSLGPRSVLGALFMGINPPHFLGTRVNALLSAKTGKKPHRTTHPAVNSPALGPGSPRRTVEGGSSEPWPRARGPSLGSPAASPGPTALFPAPLPPRWDPLSFRSSRRFVHPRPGAETVEAARAQPREARFYVRGSRYGGTEPHGLGRCSRIPPAPPRRTIPGRRRGCSSLPAAPGAGAAGAGGLRSPRRAGKRLPRLRSHQLFFRPGGSKKKPEH